MKAVAECDSLVTYYREIGKFKLLGHEEEKELGRRVREGDEEAREQFINSNLKLVVSIAKKYSYDGNLNKLIQEGNLGLMKAVERYDSDRDTRFGTYAGWWIRQAILRAIHNDSLTIRMPVYMHAFKSSVDDIVTTHFLLTGESLDDPKRIAKELRKMKSFRKFTDARVKVCLKRLYEAETVSLDEILEKSEPVLMDGSLRSICKYDLELIDMEMKMLLSSREREVIDLRFYESGIHTLQEVGNKLGISRERVRQIQVKALRKLRKSRVLQELV